MAAATSTSMAEAVLSRILNWIVPPQRGQTEDNPLDLLAVPGLTTLLDVALFQSNEGQLTSTVITSHALLATWLDVKQQAQIVLQLLKNNPSTLMKTNSSLENIESFARQALDSAMDAIERMGTDRLASAANLSDPYDSTAASTNSGGHHTHHHHHHHHHHGGPSSVLSGVGATSVSEGVLESKDETGRRRPLQRRKDYYWESPRLHCPDYIWADDVYQGSQRWIKTLDKHPVMDASRSQSGGLFDFTTFAPSSSGGGGPGNTGGGSHGASHKKHSSSSHGSAAHHHHASGEGMSGGSDTQQEERMINPEIGRQTRILVQLVEDDLPMRLYQFKQACETDAVVTKRLHLVKCEYRAPLRAFWDAHQSLLRAPPIGLVDYYLEDAEWTLVSKTKEGKANSNKSQKNVAGSKKGVATLNSQSSAPAVETQEDLKEKLQSLLQTPSLTEMLSLEMEGEKLELALGEALYPFTELARTIDHRSARLKVIPGVVEARDLPALQETVRRLMFVLCRKAGPESSTGIRPILLDLQLVPRDDEPVECTALGWLTAPVKIATPFMNLDKDASMEDRIDVFIRHLSLLSELVQTKHAFITPGNADFEFSAGIVRGLEGYDPELMKCQFADWFAIVDRQHVLQKESLRSESDTLAEEIRLAELKLSVAGANKASLQLVKERLAGIQDDRSNRLVICKEMIEEVCLREMNLFVTLRGPKADSPLQLKETSATGFLGIPLQRAGEKLPVG